MLTTFFSCFQFQKTRNNEEKKIGKEPASEIKLEDAPVLQKVAEKINEENQQKFDQLSDKLQSIESAISKISKSIDDAQKSKDDSKKEPIDESTVQTNNTTNVASKTVKRFQLKHVFKDAANFMVNQRNFSEWENHYDVKWRISVRRRNGRLGFHVFCHPIAPSDEWSIRTKLEYKVVGPNQNDVIRTYDYCYERNEGWGFPDFQEWEEMKSMYLVDGNLTVEAIVTIIETTGLGKKKIRTFDESQKDVSDVILVVRDTKFYVLKMFLASQSSVFKVLLLGNFPESKQSEVKLNGIDPDDFHYFLEVLYGESSIDDFNVEGVALLADMYDAPTAIRKCEEFILKESKMTLGKKLKIATRYNLERLKALESLVDH
ncbi:unnamed protein product [Caenorhabditis nigoni]